MILILNGSPNKNSKTLEVTKQLLNDKEEIIQLNSYQLTVESCDDCKYCEHKIGCIKKDEMQRIYELLERADTLILSSPIYFGTMSNSLMKVINRFQRYYSDKFIHEIKVPSFKNMILVCTQGSTRVRMFNGALETFHILTRLFEPEYSDTILIPNSDNVPFITKIDTLLITKTKEKML